MPVFFNNPKKQRIFTIVIFFILSIVATTIGVLTPLSTQEVADKNNAISGTRQQLLNTDTIRRTASIFQNNFLICLIMFIPVFGIMIGSIVLFSTGSVIRAEIIATYGNSVPPILGFISIFIFPYAWLEFISYSTALSETFWLFRRGLQGRWAREIINLGKLVLITAVLLATAAFMEAVILGLLSYHVS